MALVFVRPSIQHKAANVLSSTSSTGLTVQEPDMPQEAQRGWDLRPLS